VRHALLVLVVAVATACSQATTDQTSQAASSPPSTASPATSVIPTPTPTEPPTVKVPKVIGLQTAQAKSKVSHAGLDLKVTLRPSSKERGTVISQSPASGVAAPGQRITIVVAAALPHVPNVVGKDVKVATRILDHAGFRVRIRKQASSAAKDHVLTQSPSAGTETHPRTTVTLAIAKPLPAPPTTGGTGGGGGGGGNCTPGYSPCLPPASDYDCAGGSGDGPKYVTGPVRVTGSDPYGLDADGNGIGCQ
jgi:hypothetical protein